MADPQAGWERSLLEKLALESLNEQRRRRRWGIFFKLLGFGYITFIIFALSDFGPATDKLTDGQGHTALVQMNGVIKADGEAGADNVLPALQDAFEDQGTKAVVLRINSPGGSPVQSGIIYDEIRRLRTKYPDIPLYAVVEDVCASGGYYVAAAADRIYVDKASIVGSIGVLMDGFGFTGSMEKLGVERRLLTAGQNKGFLDPFSPQDARHKDHAQTMLNDIHQQFITAVRKGRGARLKETPETFSGLMWAGDKSVEMGLADGLGSLESVARDVVQTETIRDYTRRPSFAERFSRQFGADMAEGVMNAMSRTGLR